ncbi:MAG: Holliday junction resolvase RuvX [Pseudomonadales bacterium]
MHEQRRTVLSFDFGLKQIGVALLQQPTTIISPLPIIRANDGKPDWNAVEALLQEWRAQLLLVGEPLNMDGSSSTMSERARRFARQLEGRFNLPVELVDERLSSHEAKGQVAEFSNKKRNYRKQPIDSIAAQLIMQTWLAQN